MDIKVHCPNSTCRATLTVPITAAGHVARCPLCQETFLIPNEAEIAEQTASSWIEDDIEDLEDQHDQQWRQRLQDEAVKRAQEEDLRRQETAREIEKIMAGNQEQANESVATNIQTRTQEASSVDQDLPHVPSQHAEQSSHAQPSQSHHETIAPKQVKASAHESDHDQYPTDLVVHVPGPYLVVTQCTQSGVVLSFDSKFLKHDGFRLSMPVACAFTGEVERANLIARPFAFLDQSRGTLCNAYEVEAGREAKLNKSHTAKEMLARMGVIEQFPEPFRYPFPYYVRSDHSSESLKCYTTKSADGPTVANVNIPDGHLALRWLGHVNGVCGPEYTMLQKDVARLWQGEWVGLEEQVRRRIEVWAHFQNGERFRYFINDADMPKKDEGLAGVVLTDRRLIYKKFHRQGQVEYGTEAQLIIRPDGTMAGLRVKTEDGTFKCARFHFDDLQKLKKAATDLGFGLDISH